VVWTTSPTDLARGRVALLSGGVAVPRSAFSPAAVPSGVSGVLVADLFSLGLDRSSLGGMGSGQYPSEKLELVYGGAPQTLARDPNVGDDPLRTWQWAGYERVRASSSADLERTRGPQILLVSHQ